MQNFKLLNAEVKPVTKDLVSQFRNMLASPTERELNPARVKHLREKADAGQLVTFQWAVARFKGQDYRMNGQHSSTMLDELAKTANGNFPTDLKVHMDTYDVGNDEGALAILFRQFDDRKSGRTPGDVAGAYQGLNEKLRDVPRASAKLAVEGVSWYRRHILGVNKNLTGDDIFVQFAEQGLETFIIWVGEIFTIKTPEMKRKEIVAAMYACFADGNEQEARNFWAEVARGGKEYDDNHPTTVLDAWFKRIKEEKDDKIKGGDFYQGSIYAWNAYREERPLKDIKADQKKGMHKPHA